MTRPDPVAALILDEAGDLTGRDVLVVDDVDGALRAGAWAAGAGRVRWWGDDLRQDGPGEDFVGLDEVSEWTEVVLMRLPRALDRLDEYARAFSLAAPGVAVVAGGRDKHLSQTMNSVLLRHFDSVRASRGRSKSRVLHAGLPHPPDRQRPGTPWPRRTSVSTPDGTLALSHHGGVFAGGRLDPGTALLLDALAEIEWTGRRVHDLGSGSGVIACWTARRGAQVSASDVSRLAVASTRESAAANALTVEATLASGASGIGAPVDLLVSNPPFHVEAAKDSTATLDLIAELPTVVAPGGQAWLVWNSHLPYLAALREVGETELVRRDRSYTVTRTRLPG